MDPLSRGRDYYKKKDYQSALKAFTEASIALVHDTEMDSCGLKRRLSLLSHQFCSWVPFTKSLTS
jgi:hypothetical protein